MVIVVCLAPDSDRLKLGAKGAVFVRVFMTLFTEERSTMPAAARRRGGTGGSAPPPPGHRHPGNIPEPPMPGYRFSARDATQLPRGTIFFAAGGPTGSASRRRLGRAAEAASRPSMPTVSTGDAR
jgi:hypothetical protein